MPGTIRKPTVDLASRRDYFEIRDDDLDRLRSLQPFFLRKLDAIMERLSAFLERHPQTRAFLPDAPTRERVRRHQRDFFVGLLAGVLDGTYLADRERVGNVAERLGIPPALYLGAYAVFMTALQDALHEELPEAEASAAFKSFRKLVFLDQALTMERYVAAREETIATQQAAIRELSTPVIRVHERVLLVPLVGMLDDERARQASAVLLRGVSERRARIVIIDVSGIGEIDTASVKEILDAASAASLLGARTILSGVSVEMAESIVRLGVDLGPVRTVNALADAIVLANELVGSGRRKG